MNNTLLVRFTFVAVIITLLVNLQSCTEGYFELDKLESDMITWEPDLAIPLVNSSITVEDIIGQADSTNEYQYASDNFITLIYRERIFSQTVNDFFTIPSPLPIADSWSLTAGEVVDFTAIGQVGSTHGNSHDFGIIAPTGDSELSEIHFYEGQLQVSVSGDFDRGGTVQVTFPELRSPNGAPLTQIITVTSNGSSISGSSFVDISGYEMTLDANMATNSVPVNYLFTLVNESGLPSSTSTANQITVTNSFLNSRISYAEGYFGQFSPTIDPNAVSIKVFENPDNEDVLFFQDPKLKLKIKNSFGVPFQGTVNYLNAVDPEEGTVPIEINGVFPGNVINIDAANLGIADSTTYTFDSDNSNIEDVINGNFEDIVYNMSALTNPNGQVGTNFATLNSALEVTAQIELPFWGSANHYKISDTIDSPIEEIEDFRDNIENAVIRVNTLNGLPLDGILKLYFADENYLVTDSILAGGEFLVESGPINGNGAVITPQNTNHDITLDETSIENLFGSRYIIFKADLTSTNNATDVIRIYGDDELAVRIGLRIKLNASPSDLNDL